MSKITKITAREILDSRGNPTVEVDVVLDSGAFGRAQVPSGASTGIHEAVELRDGDSTRFGGKGVLQAVNNVRKEIAPAITGISPDDQKTLDKTLIALDGTANKSRLGANAILGVSMAVAKASVANQHVTLYRHLARDNKVTLPVPMLNILNGGAHAANSTDIQEFMVVPAGFDTVTRAIQAGAEVFHALKAILKSKGFGTTVGDEGGFAPSVPSNRDALDLVLNSIVKAGYKPGEQVFIALDVAASGLIQKDGKYALPREKAIMSSAELIEIYATWLKNYPIISIEDGLAEEDWAGWQAMTSRLGNRVQLVGDDLYVTNPALIKKGIVQKASNAVLIKLNQIGTVTETLDAIETTRKAGWGVVVSHRSGETEDTTVADLAVGTAAGQLKTGAPCRGERTNKYNQLIRIEEELGKAAEYAGRTIYKKFLLK